MANLSFDDLEGVDSLDFPAYPTAPIVDPRAALAAHLAAQNQANTFLGTWSAANPHLTVPQANAASAQYTGLAHAANLLPSVSIAPDFANNPLLTVGRTDDNIAEQQRARGNLAGSDLQNILLSKLPQNQQATFNANLGNPTARPKLQAITSKELLSHPKFLDLYQRDPQKANFVYQAATGNDLHTDLAQFKTQHETYQKAADTVAQKYIADNKVRLNTEHGLPEINDPIPSGIPGEPAKDNWHIPEGPLLNQLQASLPRLGVTAPASNQKALAYRSLMGKTNPDTGKRFTPAEIMSKVQTTFAQDQKLTPPPPNTSVKESMTPAQVAAHLQTAGNQIGGVLSEGGINTGADLYNIVPNLINKASYGADVLNKLGLGPWPTLKRPLPYAPKLQGNRFKLQ